jgi:hypothetical protein
MRKTNPIRNLLIVAGMALAASLFGNVAVASDHLDISSKLDSNADFSGFRTFGVVEPEGPPLSDAAERGRGSRQPDDARRLAQGEQAIRETILAELQARGFEPDREGNPDFFIGYDALVMRFDDPLNRPAELVRPGWGNTVSVTRSYSVFDSGASFEGRLTIFIVDAQSRQIIWSATAEGNIRNLRRIERNAHETVQTLMSKMPVEKKTP